MFTIVSGYVHFKIIKINMYQPYLYCIVKLATNLTCYEVFYKPINIVIVIVIVMYTRLSVTCNPIHPKMTLVVV